MQEVGSYDNLDFALVEAQSLQHVAGERAAEIDSAIALPVASNNQFSHLSRDVIS